MYSQNWHKSYSEQNWRANNNFFSIYPTIKKKKKKKKKKKNRKDSWSLNFFVVFFLKEEKWIPKYEKDIKTNWVPLKCFKIVWILNVAKETEIK